MAHDPTAPVTTPPPGVVANFVDPPSEAYILIITVVLCLTCATLMVTMRMYVNLFVTRMATWDDGLVFACWLGFIAYSINAVMTLQYGSLIDVWNVEHYYTFVKWRQLCYVEQIMYAILICGSKLSVLVLYKRIFVPSSGKRTWVYYSIVTVIAFNMLFYIANTLATALTCIPRKKIFDNTIPGRCIDAWTLIEFTSVLNALSDLMMFCIPLGVIWKLRLPRKRKAEVSFVFGFSFLGFCSSVFRLSYSIRGKRNPNVTKGLIYVALWTFAEIATCFLASCVPMVPRLIRHFWHNFRDVSAPPRYGRTPRTRRYVRTAEATVPWSWVSTTIHNAVDEEDPYYIGDTQPRENERETKAIPDTSSNSDAESRENILVSTTVEVSTIPRDQQMKMIAMSKESPI